MSQDPQSPESGHDRYPGEIYGDTPIPGGEPAPAKQQRQISLAWLTSVPLAVWFYLASLLLGAATGYALMRVGLSLTGFLWSWFYDAQAQVDALGGAAAVPWGSPIDTAINTAMTTYFFAALGVACVAVVALVAPWLRYSYFHEWFMLSTRRRWGWWRRVIPVGVAVAAVGIGGLLSVWWMSGLSSVIDGDGLYFALLFGVVGLGLTAFGRLVTGPILDLADDAREAAHVEYSGKGDC